MPKVMSRLAYVPAAGVYAGPVAKGHRGQMWDALRALGVVTDVNRPTLSAPGPSVLSGTDVGLLFVDASANSVARTLQASGAANEETILTLVRVDAVATNTAIFSANGADTIEGAATIALLPGLYLTLYLPAGSTRWRVLARGGATQQAAREALGIGAIGSRNAIIDPAMMCAQRAGAAFNLSTTAQYGQVDQIAVWAAAGAVTGGTITQATAANCGSTGYACKATAVTLTGAAVLAFRHRIRSKRAAKLKGQNAVFQARVYHDVGAAVNVTVIVRKPNATDNYTGTTVVYTSAAVSVPSGVDTLITLPAVAMGNVAVGCEVELQFACGAVAAKNFETTEWQLAVETSPSLVEIPSPAVALAESMAELEVLDGSFNYTTGKAFHCNNYAGGNQPTHLVYFKVQKSAVPTISFPTWTGNVRYISTAGVSSGLNPATFAVGADGFSLSCSNAPGAAAYGWMDGFGPIVASCRL